MDSEVYHIPALLPQSLEGLSLCSDGIYIDATLGGGGHTGAIRARLDGTGHLYSIDQDMDAISRQCADANFTPVHGNFRYLLNYCDYFGITGRVDGILADLGVSSHHFDDAARGFSFRADGPLDMRMNKDARVSAATLLSEADEDSLTTIFKVYGEFKQARRLAKALVGARAEGGIRTTGELAALAERFVASNNRKKELAQIFQALRIAVNGEMEALQEFLQQCVEVLRPGGRLAIITYHSLEDRMVKNFFRAGNIEGELNKDFYGRVEAPLRSLSSKPIVPDAAEVEANPRSRSAKLRIAEKI